MFPSLKVNERSQLKWSRIEWYSPDNFIAIVGNIIVVGFRTKKNLFSLPTFSFVFKTHLVTGLKVIPVWSDVFSNSTVVLLLCMCVWDGAYCLLHHIVYCDLLTTHAVCTPESIYCRCCVTANNKTMLYIAPSSEDNMATVHQSIVTKLLIKQWVMTIW